MMRKARKANMLTTGRKLTPLTKRRMRKVTRRHAKLWQEMVLMRRWRNSHKGIAKNMDRWASQPGRSLSAEALC
jgi:hypothetical protein